MRADFDKDWPHGHTTLGGSKARIICTDRENDKQIIALVGVSQDPTAYTAEGRYYSSGNPCSLDLINAPAPKQTVEIWLNVYPNGCVHPTKSKESADSYAGPHRIARKRVIVTDGEFDD